MNPSRSDRGYKVAKWSWLALQGLILPLAAVHLTPAGATRGTLPLLPVLGGTALLVLWLIGQSLLAMYRFPVERGPAVQLVLGYLAQLLCMLALGGNLFAASFVTLGVTLVALWVTALGLIASALRRGLVSRPAGFLGAGALFLVGFFARWLWPPFWAGLAGLAPWARTLNLLVLAANVALTAGHLRGLTTLAPAPADPEQEEEWQRWAAPTIITLILSATAAIVVAGLRHSLASGPL